MSSEPHWPHDLLREHDMAVSAGELVVRGSRHRINATVKIEAETADPRPLPALVTALAGIIGIPVALSLEHALTADTALLIALIGLPTLLVMVPIVWLLTATAKFRVVLHSPTARTTLFTSRDAHLVIALTAALRNALGHD